MNLQVELKAAEWFQEELQLANDDYVRFFVRYGGVGGIVPGFSLGFRIEPPYQAVVEQKVNGLTFYIEEKDGWYFGEKTLIVSYDETLDEPKYEYQ
ncbi:HesB/YadR/YfhF family protein [Salirhabdus salicampi]|uniref:HesB/YadR/YfhF family protein n=1 Tax=Salirhabdus salicampi TaxID=476102 RepID=UPI0020C3E334|nr:HesB/YadR/YfhF family protein [Salirhabdus salicampi]MCP8616405.1 HesB/YadR/YfhF family protein [Salirhabdus salicampi]